MIHDEELRSSHDYSEGQKEAAHRVLIELRLQKWLQQASL